MSAVKFSRNLNVHYKTAHGLSAWPSTGATSRLILRAADLDARFPGLLDSILAASGEAARAHGPLPIPAAGVLL